MPHLSMVYIVIVGTYITPGKALMVSCPNGGGQVVAPPPAAPKGGRRLTCCTRAAMRYIFDRKVFPAYTWYLVPGTGY